MHRIAASDSCTPGQALHLCCLSVCLTLSHTLNKWGGKTGTVTLQTVQSTLSFLYTVNVSYREEFRRVAHCLHYYSWHMCILPNPNLLGFFLQFTEVQHHRNIAIRCLIASDSILPCGQIRVWTFDSGFYWIRLVDHLGLLAQQCLFKALDRKVILRSAPQNAVDWTRSWAFCMQSIFSAILFVFPTTTTNMNGGHKGGTW